MYNDMSRGLQPIWKKTTIEDDHMQKTIELRQIAIEHYEKNRMAFAIPALHALADQGCEDAFLYLSLIYRDGDGTEKDELKAVRYKRAWCKKIEELANTGSAIYQLRLAYMLQFGDGVLIDESRAISLFLQIANNGCAEAQFHLSRIYAHGNCGQCKNITLESYWLAEATNSEWPMAIYYTALLLLDNENHSENSRKIYKLMKRAAELGCWQAKEYLSKIS